MPEMVKYIFSSMQESERSIKNIETALRYQARINRKLAMNLTVVTLMMTAYIAIQNKKINKLSREIKEMTEQKGTEECNA